MTAVIKIKRSAVSGNPTVLGAGELAYSSLTDNGSNGGDRLYIGTGTEVNGNAVNHVVIGGKVFTDTVSAATNSNTSGTLVKRDSSGNFSASTISAELYGNAATATTWAAPRNLSLTGDATATLTAVNGSTNVSAELTLAPVNYNIGTFGSLSAIPVLTVNGKGLVTAVSTITIPEITTTLSVAGSSGSGLINVATDTFTISGGTGVTSVYNNTTKTTVLSIGQSVGTQDNVTFNNVTVGGTLYSDDLTASNVNVTGNAVITGNLTVQGTTTTINSTTVAVGDLNLILAKDAVTSEGANGAGITVVGPVVPATFIYTSADNRWNLNKDLNVANVYGALKGNADTSSKLTTERTIVITGDAYWSASFDGSSNVTSSLTLALVNSDVDTFGDSVTVPTFTVNAKGLITAASSTAIPYATTTVKGLASFDSNQFLITSGSVSLTTVEGGTY